ncbi:MAG: DNA adenine methylase, partial [Spirochaetales bacterium]|nr:DNA adenine methylase [Spirochaetales bacterium]
FGGHGKDALSRILAPMVMEIPNLINSDFTHNVTQMDALDFVKSNSGDICYLDPPYNMHQYGSNYFMLNTVALWDKPNVNQKRGADGRFVEKAGIRKDWKNTKSPYCYKSQAPGSFANLMDNIDSRYIVLSYNTEGIIPFEELFEIMERHGKVDLHIKDYVLYRGGKQSLSRKNHNMELLLVVDRQSRKGVSDRTNVERFLNNRKVLNQLKMPYNPGRLRAEFQFDSKGLCILNPTLGGVKVFKDYTFLEQPDNLNKLSETEFTELCNKLDRAQCTNNNEECEVLISLLEKEEDLRIVSKLQKRFLVVYKKLAFKKYIAVFNDITRIIEGKIGLQESNFIDLKDKTHEIKEIAKLRFEG